MMKWVRWTRLQAWGAGPGHGEVGLAWDSPARALVHHLVLTL